MAIKSCTRTPDKRGANRHSWEFVKNVTIGRTTIVGGRIVGGSYSKKGVYRCVHCGLTKRGEAL